MADERGLSLEARVALNLQQAEAQWSAFQRRSGSFKPVLDRSRFQAGALANDVSKLDKSLISATNRVTSLGAAFSVFFGIQRGFSEFIKSTIQVEAQLARINVNLGQSGSGLKEFSAGLFDVARETGTTFEQAAKAAEEFARQGLSVAEVQKRTRDALVLARIAAIDTTEATTDLTAAVNTFNKEGLTTTDIVNRLAAVDTRFAVSSRDLGLAISRVGNSAQEAGVTFNELLGIVTAVQQSTQRGGAAIGNAFKTIFTKVSRPEVLEQLQSLGIATKDLNNNNLPAIQILKNLAATYDTLSQAQKSVLAEQVGGVYQINILKAAVKDLGDAQGVAAQATLAAANAQDEAFTKNAELNKTLQASISATGNSLKQLFASVGNERTGGLLKSLLSGFEEARKVLSGPDGGESLGKTVGDGLVRGISNVLTGPVLVGATIAIFKGLSVIVNTFQKSLRAELGLKTVSEQRAAVLDRINQIIAQATNSEIAQISNATTALAKREAILAVEQRITAEKAKQAAEDTVIARGFIQPGLGGGIDPRLNVKKRAAEGYIPALTGAATAAAGIVPAVVQEQAAIAKGVGGVSPAARAVVIPNFVFGGGKRGALVANSEEHIIENYKGSGASAIFNPKMVKQYGMPDGARKITGAASGYVPPTSTLRPSTTNFSALSLSRAAVGVSALSSPRGSFRAADGYIPNLANTPFGKYLSAIDPSYLKRFLEVEKKDPALGAFIRKTVDQDKPQGVRELGEMFGKKTLQGTPREHGLDSTTYYHIDEEPDAIRTKIRDAFGRFNMKSPLDNAADGYMPQAKDGVVPNFRNTFAEFLGAGRYGSVSKGSGKLKDTVFKQFFPDSVNLPGGLRDEFKINKQLEQAGLPVAKVIGSLDRSVARGGIAKEYIGGIQSDKLRGTQGGFLNDEEYASYLGEFRGQFVEKGFNPRDVAYKNIVLKDDIRSLQRVYETGGFEAFLAKAIPKSVAIDTGQVARMGATGYIPNLAKALSRETAAGVDPKSIYIDKDPRVKSSGNPEGLLVANRRDEPHGGYQGVNRVLAQGGNPRVAGALRGAAGGYVPNFADFQPGDLSRSGFVSASRGNLAQVTNQEVASLNELFKALSKAASSKDAFAIGEQIHAFADTLDKASKGGVIKKLSFEFNELTLKAQKAAEAEQSASQVRKRDFSRAEKELGVGAKVPAIPAGRSIAEAGVERAKSVERGFQLLEKDKTLSKAKKGLTDAEIRQSETVLGATQKLYGQARARGADSPIERPKSVLPSTYYANQAIAKYGPIIPLGPPAPTANQAALAGIKNRIYSNGGEPGNVTPNEGPNVAERRANSDRPSGLASGFDAAQKLEYQRDHFQSDRIEKQRKIAFDRAVGRRLQGKEITPAQQNLVVQELAEQGHKSAAGKFAPGARPEAIRAYVKEYVSSQLGSLGIRYDDKNNLVAAPKIPPASRSTLGSRAGQFLRNPAVGIGVSLGAPLVAGLVDSFSTRLPGRGVGGTTGAVATGAISGGLQGAGVGAIFGPIGIAVGAGVGALVGALSKATKSASEFAEEFGKQNDKERARLDEVGQFVQIQNAYNEAIKDGNVEGARKIGKTRDDFLRTASPEASQAIRASGFDEDSLRKTFSELSKQLALNLSKSTTNQSLRSLQTFFGPSAEDKKGAAGNIASLAIQQKVDLSKIDTSFGETKNSKGQVTAFDLTKGINEVQNVLKLLGEDIPITTGNFTEFATALREGTIIYKKQTTDVAQTTAQLKVFEAAANATAIALRKASLIDFANETALVGNVERQQNAASGFVAKREGISTVNENIDFRGSADIIKLKGEQTIQADKVQGQFDVALRALIEKQQVGTDNSPETIAKQNLRTQAISGDLDTAGLLDASKKLGVNLQSVTTEQDKYSLALKELDITFKDGLKTVQARVVGEKDVTETIRRQKAFSNYTKAQGAEIGLSLRGFGDTRGVGKPYLEKQDKAFNNLFDNAAALGADTSALKSYQNKTSAKDNERSIQDLAKQVLGSLNLPGFRNATFEKRDSTTNTDQLLRAANVASKSKDEGTSSIGKFFNTNLEAQKQNRISALRLTSNGGEDTLGKALGGSSGGANPSGFEYYSGSRGNVLDASGKPKSSQIRFATDEDRKARPSEGLTVEGKKYIDKDDASVNSKSSYLRNNRYIDPLDKAINGKSAYLKDTSYIDPLDALVNRKSPPRSGTISVTTASQKTAQEYLNKFALTPQKSAEDRERARKFIEQGGTPRSSGVPSVNESSGKATGKKDAEKDTVTELNLKTAQAFKEAAELLNSKQTEVSMNLTSQIQVSIANADQFLSRDTAVAFQNEITKTLEEKFSTVMQRLSKLENKPNPPAAKRQ